MPAASCKPLGLSQAQQRILAQVLATPACRQPLAEALGRVCWRTIRARRPFPHFSQASRDGFAVRDQDLGPEARGAGLVIAPGEVAAGCLAPPRLRPRSALRILTGAALPAAASRVLPFELCREEGGRLFLLQPLPPRLYIRERGCDLAAGRAIVRRGQRIDLVHLALLAANHDPELLVHERPLVQFFRTGSELVEGGSPPLGQKVDANRLLLSSLIRQYGGEPLDVGIAADEPVAIRQALMRCRQAMAEGGQKAQGLVISTGGLGPGTYDLVAQTFVAMGGELICQGLRLKPGQTFLFGRLGGLLFFGLPGPPIALPALFHALVGPALLKAQGLASPRPGRMCATLSEAIGPEPRGVLHLREGWLSLSEGQALVRPTRLLEPANVVILLPAGKARLVAGEKVVCLQLSSGAPAAA